MENNLPVNIREYQELAKKALPKMHYDYINGGAEDEHTLRDNIAAYGRILLRPRVLVDVSNIDMSTNLLGYDMPSPIIVAPTGSHKLANPEGEVATARAAASCNTLMVLSFSASCKIEEVASSCNAIRFYQLYVFKNRDISATLVRRAESHGFKAIVLTVDTPMLGRREADIRNKMVAPANANLEGLMPIDDLDTADGSKLEKYARDTLDPSLSWKDVEWLKSITSLPILLKGIVTAEDARKAVEAGAAGIIVSNHGARQLDYAPAGDRRAQGAGAGCAGSHGGEAGAVRAGGEGPGRGEARDRDAQQGAGAGHGALRLPERRRDHPGPRPDRGRPVQVAALMRDARRQSQHILHTVKDTLHVPAPSLVIRDAGSN
uniref:(S)-2-hydroxy-acid oxidase n=2 Tax=Aegilops tauschii subsp. strangulata TaxID=200361 RepID=A0A453B3A0_AEGTS